MTEAWPPDYTKVFAQRQKRYAKVKTNVAGAREFYRTRPVAFIEHFCSTYDPRVSGGDLPARLPFILFNRQRQMVQFLLACLEEEGHGLVEKCRDAGCTWVCCAFSVWLWLYWPGVSVGWGSRKEQLVDKLGDPDSIFEKMRMLILGLPREFLPVGFNAKDDLSYMKIINRETGATITGEAGDNIGRGGRKRIYFKDEASFLERPEKIEAALGDNTRVQIDISSVNGLGNVFHRRREAGQDWEPGQPISKTRANVFVFDWRDHPGKTQRWYDERRAKAEADGLLHIFAQEVDRNYSAAVQNVIIPAEWVRSAIDAHEKLGFGDDGRWAGALDVADGGGDRNAYALRKGSVLRHLEEWGERDTGVTARRAVAASQKPGSYIDVQYDCIGVGSGVKAETNRLTDEGLMPRRIRFVPWDAGAGPLEPDRNVIPGDRESPLNKDFYHNLKAQGWWQLRRRFENTHRAIRDGLRMDADELISLPSDLPLLRQLEKELSQPTSSQSARMKLMIEKTPEGTRSPNVADAVMMCFWPAQRAFIPYDEWV